MDATTALILSQVVNGLQMGLLLFLVAAGLTLIFGIFDFINLAHGAFYMLGAFVSATLALHLGGWPLAVLATLPVMALLGAGVAETVARPLLGARHHLAQVLATFGLLLVLEALAMLAWGTDGMPVALPAWLSGQVELAAGVRLPAYRLLIIAVGLAVALALHVLMRHTRFGLQMRAIASNPRMALALGAPVRRIRMGVFGLSAALAGLAGALMAPISEASLSMAVEIIIIAFVIIIIGGLGSVAGSFVAAMLVGMIDTLGRAWLDELLALALPLEVAETAAPALSSMSIYLLMILILVLKPAGLLPPPARGST